MARDEIFLRQFMRANTKTFFKVPLHRSANRKWRGLIDKNYSLRVIDHQKLLFHMIKKKINSSAWHPFAPPRMLKLSSIRAFHIARPKANLYPRKLKVWKRCRQKLLTRRRTIQFLVSIIMLITVRVRTKYLKQQTRSLGSISSKSIKQIMLILTLKITQI